MRADGVELGDPVSNDGSGVAQIGEAVKPDALFLNGADEALAEAVLLGRVGRDVFLAQAVSAYGGGVEPGAEDEPVVVTEREPGGRAVEPAKAGEQGALQSTLGGFGPSRVIEFPAEDFAGAAVDDGYEGAPAVHSAMDESDVGSPALIGGWRNGAGGCHAGPLARLAGFERPAFEAHDALDLLAIDLVAFDEAQPGPDGPDAKGGLRFDEFLNACGEHGVDDAPGGPFLWLIIGGAARHTEHGAQLGPRDFAPVLAKIMVDCFHEMPSGKSLPSMRCAFFKMSTWSAKSPTFASNCCSRASN